MEVAQGSRSRHRGSGRGTTAGAGSSPAVGTESGTTVVGAGSGTGDNSSYTKQLFWKIRAKNGLKAALQKNHCRRKRHFLPPRYAGGRKEFHSNLGRGPAVLHLLALDGHPSAASDLSLHGKRSNLHGKHNTLHSMTAFITINVSLQWFKFRNESRKTGASDLIAHSDSSLRSARRSYFSSWLLGFWARLEADGVGTAGAVEHADSRERQTLRWRRRWFFG